MFYKRSFLVALMALIFSLFGTQASAQIISNACSGSVTPVATGCVGECGVPGAIEYQVGPICPSEVVSICLRNDSSNLCPSHAAIAYVYVDGSLATSGDITAVGTTLGFSAKCGAKVKVLVYLKHVNPNINCVRLGNLNFSLRH